MCFMMWLDRSTVIERRLPWFMDPTRLSDANKKLLQKINESLLWKLEMSRGNLTDVRPVVHTRIVR